MAKMVTTMTGYTTKAYREKVREEQEGAIERLLSFLPPYVRDYSENKQSKVGIKTRREYIQDLFSFFSFLCDTHPDCEGMIIKEVPLDVLSKLSLDDFAKYENWLTNPKEGTPNSPVTIKRKKSSLRSLYTYLYASDKITTNAAAKIESTKAEKKDRTKIRVLSDLERAAFLSEFDLRYDEAVNKLNEAKAKAEAKGKPVAVATQMKPAIVKRDKAIVYLFLGSGLRVSELCAIDCKHFSYKAQQINVIRKGEANGVKDDETTNQVFINKEVADIIQEYIDVYRDMIGPDVENYDALFLSSKHSRITPRAVEQMVQKYADEALGFGNGVHPHVLRASFGFRYQQQFGNIYDTAEVMNHSSPAVTAKYYLKRTTEAQKAVQEISVK